MVETITVSALLPFRLRAKGTFRANAGTAALTVERVTTSGATNAGTLAARKHVSQASTTFEVDPILPADDRVRLQTAQAERLALLVNRFLRWYRATRLDAGVYEVTRAQLSPFSFRDASGAPWTDDLLFEPARVGGDDNTARGVTWDHLVVGFAAGGEPDVADLALVDAASAFNAGRFREAVLLCWSAIDATFNRRFKQLVDERLANDWGDARTFLKGPDFGLRQKMTTGMKLLTGRSFYDLPGNFWDRLSESYRARNRIIHEGATATEDESRRSIEVARELVKAVREI